MRVVAVVANKGGVGKSTLAFQVAAETARRGLRVLAVDADKQADLTRYARGPRLSGLGLDAVLADPPTSLDPRLYIGPVADNLDLLGSSPRLADVDRIIDQGLDDGPFYLRRALEVVADRYDWVVIDTGHSDEIAANVVVVADILLMPITASFPDANHAGDMLHYAAVLREELRLPKMDLLQRSMITIWRRQYNGIADAQVIDRLRQRYGDLVCPAIIPNSSRVSEANEQRLTVRDYAALHANGRDHTLQAVVDAYSKVAGHMLARVPAEQALAV